MRFVSCIYISSLVVIASILTVYRSINAKRNPHALYQNMRIKLAPQVGLEPTTTRLTAECSAIELLRNIGKRSISTPLSFGIRRRPTLPGRVQPSTIGAEGLNFCVRDGNRWNPFAITTGNLFSRSSLSRYPDNCTALIGLLPTALT